MSPTGLNLSKLAHLLFRSVIPMDLCHGKKMLTPLNSPLTSPLINIKDNLSSISPCHRPLDSMEEHCTFCKIIRGEKSANFLYQDESLVVFQDIRPHAPIHLLIVPREHIRSLNDLKEKDKDIIFKMIVRAREMAKEHSIAESGYRLVFNVEQGGGQVIFHLHLHLLGGW